MTLKMLCPNLLNINLSIQPFHAVSDHIGDTGCKHLVDNLPGLLRLGLRTNFVNKELHKLTNLATHSIVRLQHIVHLDIGTSALILVSILFRTTELPSLQGSKH